LLYCSKFKNEETVRKEDQERVIAKYVEIVGYITEVFLQ
jgi:hypothetical protein